MIRIAIPGKAHPFFGFAALLALFTSCTDQPHTPKDLLQEALIPQPVFVEAEGSSFALNGKTAIVVLTGEASGESEGAEKVARYLADLLKPATGFDIQVRTSGAESDDGNIYLQLNDSDPS
ncbi:MAG TPA: glycoside hydrolase family 20 zincin-like fold domain-containing protein, partial [Flavilitoribacter sp.]|nr:glycoside hydrolase family 20 zincin-like fold domain-containing protein [Flavilitoribacter sp.]